MSSRQIIWSKKSRSDSRVIKLEV